MSTTITYNGSTIAQVNNETKTLLTSGKWLTGNIILTDISDGSGGGSTSSNGYILTTVMPEQTFIATSSSDISGTEHKQAQLTYTTHLEVNSHYLVTYDNSQYIIMCYLVGGDFYTLGDMTWFFNSNSPYPFSIARLKSTQDYYIAISNDDTGEQHTIKVDKIELIDDLKFTEKVITVNGTYSALTDNADGYSSVSVSVPNAISITEVANTTGTTVVVTGTEASGGSATQHTIHLELTDGTDADIVLYYDNSIINTIITSYTLETYNQKTVDSASLDNVVWYTRPTDTWELICQGSTSSNSNADAFDSYWFQIFDNNIVQIDEGSHWRVTWNGTTYLCTAKYYNEGGTTYVGNLGIIGGVVDESGAPFWFEYINWGTAGYNGDTSIDGGITYKIERLVTGGGT